MCFYYLSFIFIDIKGFFFLNLFSATRDTPYMVFEYMLHGDLAELLRKTDPSIRGTEPTFPLRKVITLKNQK